MQRINPTCARYVEWFFSIVTVNWLLNPTASFKKTPRRHKLLHRRLVLYVIRLVHEAQCVPNCVVTQTKGPFCRH